MAKTRNAAAKPRRGKADASPLPSDLEDEVDRYHRKREKLSLNVEDDISDDDGSIHGDDAILDVSQGSESDDDEEMDTDEEMERETHLGRLARQARSLEAKLQIARGERDGSDGEEGDEDEDDEAGQRGGAKWGAGKRAYYDADIVDMEGSDEEDALRDEEEEAVRLQREAAADLNPADYGNESDDSEEEEEESDEDGEGGGRERTLGARAAAAVEAVPRDLASLDDEVLAAAVRQDALELSSLVSELRAVLGEVRGRLGPLLREVRAGDVATAEGVSYLEAKHTLMVHYAASIVFYLLLKAEGRPVRDHPVIARLVEIRAYLEKVRPVDKRLHYQIEKLLAAAARTGGSEAAAAAAAAANGDAAGHGPRPEALLVSAQKAGLHAAADGEEEDGAYRPPRLNPVSMELEEESGKGAGKERRRLANASRRAARSSLVQELAAELADAPEVRDTGAVLGMDTAAALRERQRLAARDAEEEDLMIRVPLSRDERKRLKAQRRAGLSGKALLDDFADDVADLIGEGDGGDDGVDPSFKRHRANQKFGADLSEQASKRGVRSGDADLPVRDSLNDRRARMDNVRAKASAEMDDDEGGAPREQRVRVEDDFYREAKRDAAAKKKQRTDAHLRSELLPPAEDPTAPGARRINNAIEKNRGLTPHRRKDMKNPRKKHRMKFAEANVRRKGQVQEVKAGTAGAYGGEGTGIKSRVSKSVKF